MSFSFKDRQSALASLEASPPELLIIGAGVVGCSIAAHSAKLGLNVLVIEKDDLASGASGNSTGLAHAGLRYLAQGRLGYVFREGRERQRLQEIAPQWVRPFPFILPVYKDDPYSFWMVRLGTWIYDALGWIDALLTRRPLVRRHQTLGGEAVKARVPGVRVDGLLGGIEYYVDARLQDSRFTMGYAQQSAQHGARILTHCEVISIAKPDAGPARVISCDVLTGKTFECSAPLLINASGAWIDELRRKAGMGGDIVQKSKGVHLVVDHLTDSPLIFSSSAKGKVFFVLPIDAERSLVGTTDTAVQDEVDKIQPEAKDITELLQQLFYYFPYLKQGSNLMQAIEAYKEVHVRDVYWGVRPLLAQSGATLDASRERRLIKDLPSFWSFPGVKLTAGRAAGYEAAIEAWSFLRKGVPVPTVDWDCLPGGELWDFEHFAQDAQKRFKLGVRPEELIRYLVSMYGTRYVEILQWAQRDELFQEQLLPEEPWILAQVAYAVHEEMVLTLSDLLFRRTRWARLRDLPETVVKKIAETMGRFLSWSPSQIERQILDYKEELKKHRLS